MIVQRRTDLEIEIPEPQSVRDGVDGRDGADGRPGSDGRSLNPRRYVRGRTYNRLDLVRFEDASWVCLEDGTKSAPPKGWQVLSRDGADGKDGESIAVRGPRGLPGTTTVVSGGGLPFIASGNILKGQALIVVSDGHAGPGLADDLATSAVVGLAASDVGDGMPGLMQAGGTLEADWTAITGGPLQPGAAYFLSPTVPGGLTSTPPGDNNLVVVFIGRALSETTLAIEIANPVLLSEEPEE